MTQDMNRRLFMKLAGTGLMGHHFNRLFDFHDAVSAPVDIALITNVINKELNADWKKTLRAVANIGYQSIEFNKIGNAGRQELKSFLQEIHLRPLAGGAAMVDFADPVKFSALKEQTLFFNKPYLVCYWPWMDDGSNKKADDFVKLAKQLNSFGESCNQQGIRFALHNHTTEFNLYNDVSGYDLLLRHTDPARVTMLLDIYWATKAGANVKRLLKDYPGRFELLHLKDMDDTAEHNYTCPGYGIIDFKAILPLAQKAGVRHYIIEIDDTPQPIPCITDSYRYVKPLI